MTSIKIWVLNIKMPPPVPDFFEFHGLRFYPEQASIVRLRDNATSYIRPKQRDLLIALLSCPGDTVTYTQLWATIWPEIEDFDAVRRTMTETKSTLDRLLRSILKSDAAIIQTISSQGYCIKASVTAHRKEGQTIEALRSDVGPMPTTLPFQPETRSPASASSITSAPLFGAYVWHVLGSCAIYSSAYICVLLLEVAYSSGQLWRQALLLSPVVFSWMFITSVIALIADWKLTLMGKVSGLALSILAFIGSALVLYGMLTFFLPGTPITEATFQTQTAQAAYLKNVAFYFLPLAIVFLVIPFHLVASLRNQIATKNLSRVREFFRHTRRASAPPKAIYIRPRTLALVLLIAGIASLLLTYRLLEQLRPGPSMNRFTLLVMFRLILYFGLGAECLLWYSRTLNEIKADLD